MEAELGGKRLDLLREIIPGLTRVAVVAAKTDPFTGSFVQDLQAGAARLGLQLHPVMVEGPGGFEDAFAVISSAGDQAVIIQPNFLPHTAAIVALAAKHRLATVSSYRTRQTMPRTSSAPRSSSTKFSRELSLPTFPSNSRPNSS